MDATTQRYHLMLLALETGTIKTLEKLFNQQSYPHLAQKKIHTAQVQASIIGSQLGHAQLEDMTTDEHLPTIQGYTHIAPVAIAAGITLGMLTVTARTAIIDAYRKSAISVYAANDATGWIWDVEGDDPCDWCLSMNGTVHPLTEKFESHNNCRCGAVPII